MRYEPTNESLRQHEVPSWFHDAKFGLMVHWGPCSIPAWGERSGVIQDIWSEKGPRYLFKHNPYAEWYENTIRIPGSAAQRHHIDAYGRDFPYDNFVRQFGELSARFDPSSWADLFASAGARYVVLITKHHDGYALWPSAQPNPRGELYASQRDIVGDVTEAVRARGLTMGLYYSGGYDKTFNPTCIRSLRTAIAAVPQDEAYARYADAHVAELIERYRPSVLWNDIAYPARSDLKRIFADYYNVVPEGIVNDRWTQFGLRGGVRRALVMAAASAIDHGWPLLPKRWRRLQMQARFHHDFSTPEYDARDSATEAKWETVRGIGTSFGNNRTERDEDLLSAREIVHMIADVASKNGNLLLGIAPDAQGVFPEQQTSRILEAGRWLAAKGAAIYGTRPWTRAEGSTADGLPVRYTATGDALYAIVLGEPQGAEIAIEGLVVGEGAEVCMLGGDASLSWTQHGDRLAVTLPERRPHHALALKITPKPSRRSVMSERSGSGRARGAYASEA